eukprot:scaffold12131_cov71-Cyclotella_meneghiniana.AAC.14
MSFRTNLYEQDNDKELRPSRHSFVNRLRTHTDGDINSTFSPFNNIEDSKSFRRNRFSANHMAGEVMSSHALPSSALPIPSIYNNDKANSPIARSFRKLRSQTWDAGHGNNLTNSFRLSPRMTGHVERAKPLPFPDGDDVVSFSSSAEEGSSDDQDVVPDNAGIPDLDDVGDGVEAGTQSSLYHDELTLTPVKNILQPTEESNSQLINDSTPKKKTVQQSSLKRDTSSSSNDAVKRSVTFSSKITEVEQFTEEIETDHCTPESNNLEFSPIETESDHDSTAETIHYLQNYRQQQQRRSQPKTTGHEQFLHRINPFSDLSWSLVGSYIVRYAPCFMCMKKLGVSATDRIVLMRLNLLCAFCAIVQIAVGMFLLLVTYMGVEQTNDYYNNLNNVDSTWKLNEGTVMRNSDDQLVDVISPDMWNLMLFVWVLSCVSLVLLIASYFAQRAIRNVNLVKSVRFMW